MDEDEIFLGVTAKDIITGFEGLVTGLTEYISGCNQALLAPGVDKEGKRVEGCWFDVQRLRRVGNSVLVLDNSKTPGSDMPAPIK